MQNTWLLIGQQFKLMSKEYKISYKISPNTRLKLVDYHGIATYPIYVRVSYKRDQPEFKSYYFDLFSKPKYLLSFAGKLKFPSVADIIAKEEEVVRFVIDKLGPNFSLEGFKSEYQYYSRDLCDQAEQGFNEYLQTFLSDEGMPDFAKLIQTGVASVNSFNLLSDLKQALNGDLYAKLIENALYYSPPYLPIYGFIQNKKVSPILTARDLEEPKTREKFNQYLQKNYAGYEKSILAQIDRLLNSNR